MSELFGRVWRVVAAVMATVAVGLLPSVCAAGVRIAGRGEPLAYCVPLWSVRPVTEVAAGMLDGDFEAVTGERPVRCGWEDARVRVVNLATASPERLEAVSVAGVAVDSLRGRRDAFCLCESGGRVYVVGADDRGTAYGMLELSRMAGVSPWVWWGDAAPRPLDEVIVPEGLMSISVPSVEWRGVFLNDEDWSLLPWASLTFEPGLPEGTIGPRTYGQICRLLLRLRANLLWPAMHPCTTPFFLTPGAREAADSCGITIGTSHCEPLLRNNVGEWDAVQRGEYNYVANRSRVLDYWAERLREVKGGDYVYTLGMRGIHDGAMAGVSSKTGRVEALRRVIDDQRQLLRACVDTSLHRVPQVFVPYKEVLDVMDGGLCVPDDVTLLWCDDNYGYLTRLDDPVACGRTGGAGVYYHLSYWGRPHDYLWHAATQPGLVCHQMHTAYDRNARRMWVANIHDPKTAAYPLELFLDMAWDINSVTPSTVDRHLDAWLCREYGAEAGAALGPVMRLYYDLCALRRPEHWGWTQVEMADRKAHPRGRSSVRDTDLSLREIDSCLRVCDTLASRLRLIAPLVPPSRRDSYFASVEYPVRSAAAMTRKMLEAQRARSVASGQSRTKRCLPDTMMLGACARSLMAYQELRRLTAAYNDSIASGRWRGLMDMSPRDLPVFGSPVLPVGLTDDECARYAGAPFSLPDTSPVPIAVIDASGYTASTFAPSPVAMLGHSRRALPLPRGERVDYGFTIPDSMAVNIVMGLVPTHPLDGGDLRVSMRVDGGDPHTFSIREKGRTERWKENVLRGQARVETTHTMTPGSHTLTVEALDLNIIIDRLIILPAGMPVPYMPAVH